MTFIETVDEQFINTQYITPSYVFQKLQDKFENINPYGLDTQQKFNEAVNWIFAETIAETINESRKLSGETV